MVMRFSAGASLQPAGPDGVPVICFWHIRRGKAAGLVPGAFPTKSEMPLPG